MCDASTCKNKGIRNEIKDAVINRRHDIMAARHDGTIDQFKIMSKTDKADKLYERMRDSRLMMGNRGGAIKVENIMGGN